MTREFIERILVIGLALFVLVTTGGDIVYRMETWILYGALHRELTRPDKAMFTGEVIWADDLREKTYSTYSGDTAVSPFLYCPIGILRGESAQRRNITRASTTRKRSGSG